MVGMATKKLATCFRKITEKTDFFRSLNKENITGIIFSEIIRFWLLLRYYPFCSIFFSI